MNSFIIMIILISVIITTSKVIMRFLRQQDIKNGLNIKDDNYSVKKTLLTSGNQEKRLKSINKMTFSDYKINQDLWKKGYIIAIISAGAGLIVSIITKYGAGGIILTIILSSVIYYSKQLKYLFLLDVLMIISLFFTRTLNYSYLVVAPAVILFNYIVIIDYNKYMKEQKQLSTG